jgi:hypothetical protein
MPRLQGPQLPRMHGHCESVSTYLKDIEQRKCLTDYTTLFPSYLPSTRKMLCVRPGCPDGVNYHLMMHATA